MRDPYHINFALPPLQCQWKAWFFGGVTLLLFGVGCGGNRAPEYDSLRSQQLREAGRALEAAAPTEADAALERLAELSGDDAFVDMARARLSECNTLRALNEALGKGDLEGARAQLREATGSTFRTASEALPRIEALEALHEYLQKRPFNTSEQAQATLSILEPHLGILRQAPAFIAFLRDERQAVQALNLRERTTVLESLLNELDRAAVAGVPDTGSRLAHLAVIAPDHALLAALRAAASNDADAVRQLTLALADPHSRRATEIGLCIGWYDLSAAVWLGVGPNLCRERPASLSGQLLRAAACSENEQWSGAIQSLRALAASITPAEDHLARLLNTHVLPPRQVQAWCWQTPCPGIPELLSRIAQLRTYQAK